MNFSEALAAATKDAAKITRNYWSTDEYRRSYGYSGGLWWVQTMQLESFFGRGNVPTTTVIQANDMMMIEPGSPLFCKVYRYQSSSDGSQRGQISFGWGPTTQDMLAEDWRVLVGEIPQL